MPSSYSIEEFYHTMPVHSRTANIYSCRRLRISSHTLKPSKIHWVPTFYDYHEKSSGSLRMMSSTGGS
jgi:hypothetical protein